ncbi:hypothetical protein [Haloterrigena alkaliphila]|uniref:hypothetical protein n=1 Tax=Haloterrigena alkaliphila TaxID=2816475 RepID=UPI001CFFAD08|nr:hypothetical protein [Haloterrigena alkaliphila]UHQ95309.1 hypothetical protein J0X25_20795 [Haloterrigena alkaliphila]
MIAWGLVAVAIGAVIWTDAASASNVAAGLGEDRDLTVPTWLTLLTGATAVAASAILAALVTDRSLVDAIHEWRVPLVTTEVGTANKVETANDYSRTRAGASERSERPSTRAATATRPLVASRRTLAVGSALGSLLGLLALAAVVAVGLEGPATGIANLGVILAFVGLRALGPMVAVLLVDPWPAIDPFRTLARGVGGVVRGSGDGGLLAYPSRLRSWPAVVGLGLLVWLEIVLPVTADPGTLALVAGGYAVATVTGAVVFSPETWFRRADPLAVLFRLYGSVAPIQRVNGGQQEDGGQREGGGFRLVLPGARLRDRGVVADASEVAFVLLLVWELTFNGFVVTPPGRRTIEAVVSTGVPAALAYLLVLSSGFGLSLGLYWLAARLARRTAPTYLAERELARRFAPPLLAIAAGYHVAHYLAFAISVSPAALAALSSPFAPPVNPTTLALPDWVGIVEIGAVLAGHVLAIWTAHATAFDCFPGRLQAIRSQYPFVVVMVCYTVVSLWLLTLPAPGPVYVGG